MSHDSQKLLSLAHQLESLANAELVKIAKKKEKKKLDPKAKVRNRGTVCVPASSAKDKKDHFPINDENQARNALARVQQLSSAPWYNGSLEGLKALVSRKVHSKYPSIGKSDKKKKSSSVQDFYNTLLNKYGQAASGTPAATAPTEPTDQLNQVLAPFGYSVTPGTVHALPSAQYVDVTVQAGPKAKWQGTGHQSAEIKKIIDPIITATYGFASRPIINT